MAAHRRICVREPEREVVDASDGRHVVMDYNAEAGDLLSAFAFTLPET